MAKCTLSIFDVDKWENIGSTFYVNTSTKGIWKIMHTLQISRDRPEWPSWTDSTIFNNQRSTWYNYKLKGKQNGECTFCHKKWGN